VKLFSGDTLLRVASLALAVMLWMTIAGRDTAERGVAAPVEFRNVPPDLELTGDLVNSVSVRLRTSPGLVESLDAGQVVALVDLEGKEEGEHIIQLTPEQVRVPFGFRVLKITPSLLTLSLEQVQAKMIPVRPRILGRPAPGYEVTDLSSDPAEVEVKGPKSRVQEIESAFTEPVSVDGADVTVEQYVNVGLEDSLLPPSRPGQVRVVVVIRERRERRIFDRLPVIVRGQPAELKPSVVRVEVSGSARVLRDLTPADIRPYVNVAPDHDRTQPLPVAVEIASGHTGAEVVQTEPAEVRARLLSSGGGVP
jgi:YbbR domain-containing protein